MAMDMDESPASLSPSLSPSQTHDTHEPTKTERRRSKTMMISPNLVAALEYDERTRAMTDAWYSTASSSGHIPISNPSSPSVSGGLPPPPRTRKNSSSTAKTKAKSENISPSHGGLPSPSLPPQLPPLQPSPSLSKEIDMSVKPSTWNPYINPAPKLTITSAPPPFTVSAPNSPVIVVDVERETRYGMTALRGHSNTFSAPSSPPVVGKTADQQDGTQRVVPRHRRYLSSLTKVDKILSMGKISIGGGRRSDGTKRSGEPESPVFEGRKRSQDGTREMEEYRGEVLNISPRSIRGIPSSWRTDRAETRSPARSPTSPSSGDATGSIAATSPVSARRVARERGSDGRRGSDSPPVAVSPTASQHSDGRARADSLAGSIESISGRSGSQMGTGLVRRSPATSSATSPTFPRRIEQLAPRSESGQDHDSNNDSLSTFTSTTSPYSPHISISSTIYPSSSALSHSIDIYSDYPPGRSSMSPDRESFIDLASPTFPSPHSQDYSSNSDYASLIPPYATTPRRSLDSASSRVSSASRTDSFKLPFAANKPPLPTTPKPDFKARASVQLSSQRTPPPADGNSTSDSPKPRPSHAHNSSEALPPTTNLLNPQERAERVKKTRKIAQLFGQYPGPNAFSNNTAFEGVSSPSPTFLAPPNPLTSALAAKRNLKHQRGAASLSMAEEPSQSLASPGRAVWPPPEGTLFLNIGGRRHSSPLSPQEVGDFNEDILPSRTDLSLSGGGKLQTSTGRADTGSVKSAGRQDWERRARGGKEADPSSPTSFMDLSDEEAANDGPSSIITVQTPRPTKRAPIPFSPTDHSPLHESVTSQENTEEERRRKREKLAKLHRFLGSRVPLDLVLAQVAITPTDPALPFPASAIEPGAPSKNVTETRKVFMRRRRSSSAAEFSASWSDEIDRLKEDLNEREKAINVRRAVKMEKMFGVAPPQTLYHTRPTTSPSGVPSVSAQPPPSPGRIPTPPLSPIIFATRNPNQSAYSKVSKSKKQRPGTADSSEPLITTIERDSYPIGLALSDVYIHYRHSLNSLNDIIDRDDKESLVDLHDYLHGNASEPLSQPFALDSPGYVASPTVAASTSRSERRRSLPTRTSMTSLYSESSIATPTSTENNFQTRRRRAAKLTQFFGVNYRELMGEIIESIEKGLEEERGKGTLKPDEVQDLLQKLVKLKVKRNTFN